MHAHTRSKKGCITLIERDSKCYKTFEINAIHLNILFKESWERKKNISTKILSTTVNNIDKKGFLCIRTAYYDDF